MGPTASPSPAAPSAATEWYTHRGAGSLTRTGSLIRRHRVVRPLWGQQPHLHRRTRPPHRQAGMTAAKRSNYSVTAGEPRANLRTGEPRPSSAPRGSNNREGGRAHHADGRGRFTWLTARGVAPLTRGYRVVRPLWGRQPHPHRQPHPPPQSGTPTAGPAASPAPAASSAATEQCDPCGGDSLTHTSNPIRRHRVVRPPRGRQHHPHRQPHPTPQSSAPPSGPATSPAHRR